VAVLFAAAAIGGMGRDGGGFELGSGWPALRRAAVGRLDVAAAFFCCCGGCGCACTGGGAGAGASGCGGGWNGALAKGFVVLSISTSFSFPLPFFSSPNPKLNPNSPSPVNEMPEIRASDHNDKSELSAWCKDSLGGRAGVFFVLDDEGGGPDPEAEPESAEDDAFVFEKGAVQL